MTTTEGKGEHGGKHERPGQETSGAQTSAQTAGAPRRDETSGRAADGLSKQMQEHHRARVEVPGRDDVDGRLDNRTPEMLREAAAPASGEKPQHVDGPDVAHQAEHTAAVLKSRQGRAGR